jgi:hypothetical protein
VEVVVVGLVLGVRMNVMVVAGVGMSAQWGRGSWLGIYWDFMVGSMGLGQSDDRRLGTDRVRSEIIIIHIEKMQKVVESLYG